ncbi:MAG: aminoacyl-tRNA hydrolase [Candidatus Moranbacteria bacterium]|nr:aminoacyl-tRNA hydrolase [Candidatus Moranbacteria bacterium]
MFGNKYKLIVGLGNPGKEYEKNRHNAGFIVLDILREALGLDKFDFNKKFNCEISEQKNTSFVEKIGLSGKEKIILAKPQTFMNRSGDAVGKIASFYKIKPENITIVHDDLDIIIGNYKESKGSGAAGHNGIIDIIKKLGTKEFSRIKVGVEQKEGRQSRKIPGQAFVLQDFTETELEKIKSIGEAVAKTFLYEK